MTTISIKNKEIEEGLAKYWNNSFESLQNLILLNFIKNQLSNTLKEEAYSDLEIEEYAQDYLNSFNSNAFTDLK